MVSASVVNFAGKTVPWVLLAGVRDQQVVRDIITKDFHHGLAYLVRAILFLVKRHTVAVPGFLLLSIAGEGEKKGNS